MQRLGVGRQSLLVKLAGGRIQLDAGAGRAVQGVMQPLGEFEEFRVALNDQPTGVDVETLGVTQQRPQHLRDATAHGGGVDIPQRAVTQTLAQLDSPLVHQLHVVPGNDGAEALHGLRRKRDFLKLNGHALGPCPAGLLSSPMWRSAAMNRTPVCQHGGHT